MAHVKRYGISDYFSEHFPRFDLYNNKHIEFQSPFQYFTTYFNSSDTAFLWTRKIKKAERLKIQEKVKEEIGGVLGVKPHLFILELLGFPVVEEKIKTRHFSETTIFVDTRERRPLPILKGKRATLNFGDYCMENSTYYVERKSLNDLTQTLTKRYEEFLREMERAKLENKTIVVLVEASVEDVWNIKKILGRFSKVSAPYLISRILDFYKLTGVQFLFSGNRTNSALLLPKIVSCETLDVDFTNLRFLCYED